MARFVFGIEPVEVSSLLEHLGSLRYVVELVLAVRCALEQSPAATVHERWPNDLREDVGRMKAILIKHNPIKVQTTKTVGVVSAIDPHLSPVREVHTQLGLIDLDVWDGSGIVTKIVEGAGFPLGIRGCDVPEARPLKFARQRAPDELIHGEDRLA